MWYSRHLQKNCIKLVVNDIDIQKVHMCRPNYLGLYFDDQLTWRFHIDYVYNRLLQLIDIFYKLRSKLQYVWLRNIYYAFVHPYLMYGIESRYMLIHILRTWIS